MKPRSLNPPRRAAIPKALSLALAFGFSFLAISSVAPAQDFRTWSINTGSNNYPNYISYHNGAFYLYAGDGNISLIDPTSQVGTNNPFASVTGVTGLTSYQANHTWGYSINSRGQNVLLAFTNAGADSIIILDATGHRVSAWPGPNIPGVSQAVLPDVSDPSTHPYNLIATDSADRVYVGDSNGVQVFDSTGNSVKTIAVNGVAASVAIDPDDQTLWVISYPNNGTNPDALSHYDAYPNDSLLSAWNINSPIPGIPGAPQSGSNDRYTSWGEVAVASSRVEITQGYAPGDPYHRVMQLFGDSVRLNCSLTTSRIRVRGLCLHGDTMLDMEMDESTKTQYLNFVTGSAFCDNITDPTPTGLSVTNGTSCVNLQWNASSGASEYNVYRRAPGGTYSRVGEPTTAGTSASPFQDCAVRPNTEYCYVVTSVNSSGFESAYSTEECNTPNPPSPSDYNFSVTTDKTNGIYNKGDQIIFTFHVTRKADNSAVAGAGVIVYDPSIGFASCPNVTTDGTGTKEYTSTANGLSGYAAYGFEFTTPPSEAITDSEQYWVFIDDGSTLTTGAHPESSSTMAYPVSASTQTKPITADEVVSSLFDGFKSAILNPAVIGGAVGCTAAGVIALIPGIDLADEIPAYLCAEDIPELVAAGAQGAGVIGAAVSATDQLIDNNLSLTPTQQSQYKSYVGLFNDALDVISIGHDLTEAPAEGEALYTALFGDRKLGIRDFGSILSTASDYTSAVQDLSSSAASFVSGSVNVSSIPNSSKMVLISPAILSEPVTGGFLSPVLTIAFSFDPLAPLIPMLITPSNNDTTNLGTSATLQWDTATRALTYQLQVGTDSSAFPLSRTSHGKVQIQSTDSLLINDSALVTTYTALSNLQPNQEYYWRVRSIGDSGRVGNWSPIYQFNTGVVSSVNDASLGAIQFTCYPNPTTTSANLSYSLPTESSVSITIYDALGRVVASPVLGEMESAGQHATTFDTQGLPNGLYLCRLAGGGIVQSAKMVIAR